MYQQVLEISARPSQTTRPLDSFIHMRNWAQAVDADLLANARSDPDAFACFYDRYETAVVGYFVRRTRDAGLAGELAAETFASALGAAARYIPRGSTAAPWLFTIAQNVLLKSARRERVEDAARMRAGMALRLDLTDASRERVEAAVDSEDWVERLLDSLPPDQRDAIQAHIVEDRSYAELARLHRTSEPVIRKRVSRGLTNLRRRLERTT
jgi:RNA polymerase sigma factor (sigma-70 family)